FIQYFNIQSQRLELFQQYFEGFRYTRFRDIVALDNSFISLHSSYNIIGFYCQDFLQCISCAISFQSPYLHLSKTLSAELSFSTQRLLCYERVWTCRTCMDLIVYQMMQFQIMHESNGYRAVKFFSCTSVTQPYFSCCI